MKQLLILGAGTGGTIVANMLRHELNRGDWAITVIDKSAQHLYQPGLLFIPFRLYGYETAADVARPIEKPLPKHVDLVRAEITAIDTDGKRVKTSAGDYHYDWLISSLGCDIAPDEVEGLPEALGRNAFTFYSLEGALRMQQALDEMNEGRLVINIAEMPIKCPVAPIEFAFLADYYFQLKEIRDRIDITLVTPFSGAFTKPVANSVLTKTAKEKGVRIVPNFSIERVDADNKSIHAYEGTSLDYDLLCIVPPNLGPRVLDEAGLGDGTGYALTDPRTLKSRKADRVFVIGDNSNVATSKAGSVTHFEAETVVNNVLREIEGKKSLPSFDGHANCFIETGHHKAMLLDFNYDLEPLQGDFPVPGMGPFSLLEESYMNHVGKIAFDWVYWHMLLPGYLPHVPLLPSHMSFLGKNLSQTPQVRRSRATRVEKIMNTEVITVRQGTSLVEAAKLLVDNKISGLPVVDVDGKLIGIVTEADFLSAIDLEAHAALVDTVNALLRKGRGRKTMGTIVDDLMTPDPVTIKPGDTLERAVHLMHTNQIKRIVVTDDAGKVQGIVARPDLVGLFLSKV